MMVMMIFPGQGLIHTWGKMFDDDDHEEIDYDDVENNYDEMTIIFTMTIPGQGLIHTWW